jgi:hypothetical protein
LRLAQREAKSADHLVELLASRRVDASGTGDEAGADDGREWQRATSPRPSVEKRSISMGEELLCIYLHPGAASRATIRAMRVPHSTLQRNSCYGVVLCTVKFPCVTVRVAAGVPAAQVLATVLPGDATLRPTRSAPFAPALSATVMPTIDLATLVVRGVVNPAFTVPVTLATLPAKAAHVTEPVRSRADLPFCFWSRITNRPHGRVAEHVRPLGGIRAVRVRCKRSPAANGAANTGDVALSLSMPLPVTDEATVRGATLGRPMSPLA